MYKRQISLLACGQKATTSLPQLPPPPPDDANAAALQIHAKSLEHLYTTNFKIQVVIEKYITLCAVVPINSLQVNQVMELAVPLVLAMEPQTTTTATTVQLQVQLVGAFRREIAMLWSLCHIWFRCMDGFEHVMSKMVPLPARFQSSSSLVTALFFTPLVVGILAMMVLPFFAPAIAAMMSMGVVVFVATMLLWASTTTGRAYLQESRLVQHYVVGSPVVQSWLYPIGPRPTPVTLLRSTIIPQNKWWRLILSLLMDIIGCASYLLPFGLGELSDLAWAPLQTTLIMAMYETTNPKLKYLSFLEEILPWTDFIPSATIGWYLWNKQQKQQQSAATGDSSVPDDLLFKEE
mgnify:CR=1 FL=1